MFLSRLEIDVDIVPGRLWLRNIYRVHQRLCMAFPSLVQKENDPDFLKPYAPHQFPEDRYLADKKPPEVGIDVLRQVHAQRAQVSGFLFRIDPRPGGNPIIVVQSALKPDWDYAFHNAGYLLAALPKTQPFEPAFTSQQALRFRLVANPTRKIDTKTRPDGSKSNGQRVPVPTEKLGEWLTQRAEGDGFHVEHLTSIRAGFVYWYKDEKSKGKLRSTQYDGILQVTNPARFCDTIMHGIGPAKAFGFGLLSIAPVKERQT